ncbi:hypothetical protein LCGC14_3031690 [marine sediment metagenome]|uniref:Uncharacterized protein n=1 Tax=marine sediment metagenome TaxID=412755 RepID=A0A0F8WS19_9ZZZZ
MIKNQRNLQSELAGLRREQIGRIPGKARKVEKGGQVGQKRDHRRHHHRDHREQRWPPVAIRLPCGE